MENSVIGDETHGDRFSYDQLRAKSLEESRRIRNSYLVFPKHVQPFITLFTGKPLEDEKPSFIFSGTQHLVLTLVTFVFLLFANFIFAKTFSIQMLLVIPTSFLIVFCARKITITIIHHCLHYSFSGNHKIDNFLGDFLSILMVTQNRKSFRKNHIQNHHNLSNFGYQNDPDAAFLIKYGLKPRMSEQYLFRHFKFLFISPYYHLAQTLYRLKSNLWDPSPLRISASIIYFLFWGGLIFYGVLSAQQFIIGFLFPMIIVYNWGTLLEVATEHAWLTPNDLNVSTKEYHSLRCWGRFCGEIVPSFENNASLSQKILTWVIWTIRHLIIHLPYRLIAVNGDLVQHDFHHRRPSWDWTKSLYLREEDIKNGSPGWPTYEDIWGPKNALSRVFLALSYQSLTVPLFERSK